MLLLCRLFTFVPLSFSLHSNLRFFDSSFASTSSTLIMPGGGAPGPRGQQFPPTSPPPQTKPPRSCGAWIGAFFRFLLKVIWALPCVVFFFTLSLLMAIPWTYIKACRPHERGKNGRPVYRNADRKIVSKDKPGAKNRRIEFNQFENHKITKAQLDRDNHKHSRTVWALPGHGPERNANGEWETTKVFFVRRTWEMYELLRELWRMINRQGLQLISVACGATIVNYQVELIVHDYLLPSVSPNVSSQIILRVDH